MHHPSILEDASEDGLFRNDGSVRFCDFKLKCGPADVEQTRLRIDIPHADTSLPMCKAVARLIERAKYADIPFVDRDRFVKLGRLVGDAELLEPT